MIVTVITGTSSGIGMFLARYYLESGHYVIGCSRKKAAIEHARYRHFICDVSVESDVRKMISEIHKEYGKIDHLINNAGIASMNMALLTPLVTAKNIINTNFIGSFLFMRETAKIMHKNKFGRIINISTIACPLGLPGESLYAASKSAIETFTRIFAKEVASFGITVNCIGPGPIDTALINGVSDKKINDLIKQQALQKKCEVKDIANVSDFLIDRKSEMITGQTIYLGGV